MPRFRKIGTTQHLSFISESWIHAINKKQLQLLNNSIKFLLKTELMINSVIFNGLNKSQLIIITGLLT